MPSDNKLILAVIVIYNENLYATPTYRSFLQNELNNNALKLFIYDNSPTPQHKGQEFDENIIYYHDPNNSGLSKAYNVAGKYALQNGYQWILLLDQDTDFSKITINDYLSSVLLYKNIYLHAPVVKLINTDKYLSPTRKFLKMSRPGSSACSGVNFISDYAIINSGMLINTNAFHEVGGYNEHVWLDYSDYEFLEKYKSKYRQFAVIPKTCIQNFSDIERNPIKIQTRFKIFIECIDACHRSSLYDKFCFELILFKRMLNLSLRTQSFAPFRIYMKQHLLKNQTK